MKTINTLALGGALAALTFATTSFAQPAPAAGQGQRPAMEGRERPSPEQRSARMTERLRTSLQLTSQQEAALTTYVRAMTPRDGARGGDRDSRRAERQAMANLPTPARLDAMAARMAERQQAFAVRAEATKRFYAQLTPTQQKAFDALRPAGRGQGHGGRHGGGMGGGGPTGR